MNTLNRRLGHVTNDSVEEYGERPFGKSPNEMTIECGLVDESSMLLNERKAGARRTQERNSHPPGARGCDPEPTGTATYRCYRYDRTEHGLPMDAEGTVLLNLPSVARIWHRNPWYQFEADVFLDAGTASAWLGVELREAAHRLRGTDPAAERRITMYRQACEKALFSLDSACQVIMDLPGGNLLGLAIVAIWDSTATHPLLQSDRRAPVRVRNR